MTRANVYRIFSMVLQDTWTFEDTIRNNIAYASPGVSEEEIEEDDANEAISFAAAVKKDNEPVKAKSHISFGDEDDGFDDDEDDEPRLFFRRRKK